MRQSAAPHRIGIVLVDRILVASSKRNGDPGRTFGQALGNVPTQILADSVEPPRRGRLSDGDVAQGLANRADAPEPGVAREIISAGERHRWRRGQPGAHADTAPGSNSRRKVFLINRDPHLRRQGCIGRSNQQPDLVPRCEMVDRFDRPGNLRDHRMPQPSARPTLPRPSANPATARAAATHRKARHSTALSSANHRLSRCRSRRRTRAEAVRARLRGASPAPRQRRKTASSNSPEHAVEEALPLC